MKKILLLLFVAFIAACNSTKKPVENTPKTPEKIEQKTNPKPQEIKRVKARKAIATKNDRGYLIGITDKNAFKDDAYKYWFEDRYSEYETNKELIAKIKPIINNFSIKGFMGTWCRDSRRELPRFYKLLEETGFNEEYFELIAVGRSKKTPDNLQEGLDIIRVPTFIFYKNGKEVGRFVEYPRESLEKDILKILTEQPYKHSYDRTK